MQARGLHPEHTLPTRVGTALLPPRRRPWRFRRCPACRGVLPAGRLVQLDLGSQRRTSGSSRCRCPFCGYTASRAESTIVREARAGVR